MPLRGEALQPPLEKPRPRVLDKITEDRKAEAKKRAVHGEVDERDGKRCRCCGRRGNPNSLEAIGKIHRAHIKDASLIGPLVAANLVSLCWICHALEHAKQLFMLGKNADKLIRFEILEVAVVEVFGTRTLPRHVRIITASRRDRHGD